MYGGKALESNAQVPEVVQPREGALDNLRNPPWAAAVRLATACDLRRDTGRVQGLAIFVVVVTAIGLQNNGLSQRPAALAKNGRNGLDQRQRLSGVLAIGTPEDQRERDAVRFGNEMVL